MTMTKVKKPDARVGYSPEIVALAKAMNPHTPVYKFAMYCIDNNIPVSNIARVFGVTRATVYNWFDGTFYPRGRHLQRMLKELADAGIPAL